jgi:hypothetical protein
LVQRAGAVLVLCFERCDAARQLRAALIRLIAASGIDDHRNDAM